MRMFLKNLMISKKKGGTTTCQVFVVGGFVVTCPTGVRPHETNTWPVGWLTFFTY